MSFSQEQKKYITEQIYKSRCCKNALLEGMLAARGYVEDGTVCITCDSSDLAQFGAGLVREVLSVDAQISNGINGGRIKRVLFTSDRARRYIDDFLLGKISHTARCRNCQTAFLRGVFLACGRVSDPAKQYSLDLACRGRTDRISEVFTEFGLNPKVAIKQNEELVYFRRSSDIEDFFALASMNNAAFAFMNAKIQGEFRNNANRIANCETNNIEKAVNSSGRQLSLIRELDRRGLISQLPDELEQTARLRMEHGDMSLSQLASLFSPTISKSGLSHRLKRIDEIALSLLGEK